MTHHEHEGCCGLGALSRRKFITLAALGGGLTLMAPRAAFSGQADALLLSCMDYRLVDDVVRYMDQRGMTNKYDHVILAGASLGAVADKLADWHKTFWQHLKVAIDLHHVHKVIILDHRDCGAYKLVMGPEHAKDPDTERKAHAEVLGKLRAAVLKEYPNMEVETLLMALDGGVEVIPA